MCLQSNFQHNAMIPMTLRMVVFQVRITSTYTTLNHKSIRYTRDTIHIMYLQGNFQHNGMIAMTLRMVLFQVRTIPTDITLGKSIHCDELKSSSTGTPTIAPGPFPWPWFR